jgi:DtxR family Mn-dependent transcriptional regulator
MTSAAVENYLKAIDALQRAAQPPGEARGSAPVALGELAKAVGVTPGTATTMVKKLARDRFVKYERYAGVSLTLKGERAARAVLRRHRLIETFLVRTLGMDWSEVHDEAERLEHAISDRLLDQLDDFLGSPAVDPHGDPIPDANGRLRGVPLVAIARCARGTSARLARVLDQRAEFLHFLDRHGLRIDATIELESIEPGAGTITVRVERGPAIALSEAAAANLLVEPLARHRGMTR